MYRFLWGLEFSVRLSIYIRVELLDHMTTLGLTLGGTMTVFQSS